MYLKFPLRKHPQSEKLISYYRLVKSFVMLKTGYTKDKVAKYRLYESDLHLYRTKDTLENTCPIKPTSCLIGMDKISSHDLSNTYFEGEKRNIQLATEVTWKKSANKNPDKKECRCLFSVCQSGCLGSVCSMEHL